MTDSVKSAAEAEARTRFVDYGAPSSKKRARVLERQVAFVSGAIWKSQQDESEAMKVAAQRAVRIRELESDLAEIRAALSTAPDCGKYDEAEVVSCGWKRDMQAVRAILDGDA